MKTFSHLWQYVYLAQFFLEWEIFAIKVAEKIKTHILYSLSFLFSENLAMYEMCRKMWWSERDNRWHYNTAHALCKLGKECCTRARIRTRQRTREPTRTGTHTRTYCYSTVTMVPWTRLNITLYVLRLSPFQHHCYIRPPFRHRFVSLLCVLNLHLGYRCSIVYMELEYVYVLSKATAETVFRMFSTRIIKSVKLLAIMCVPCAYRLWGWQYACVT